MDALTYILNSAGWSVFGFLGGWFVARAGREVHEIKEIVVPDYPQPHTETKASKQSRILRFFGIMMVILSVVSVASAWVTIENDRENDLQKDEQLQCQVDFNTSILESFALYQEYAESDRQALLQFFTAGPPEQESEVVDAAGRVLVDTYFANDAKRKKNPIPEIDEAAAKCDSIKK